MIIWFGWEKFVWNNIYILISGSCYLFKYHAELSYIIERRICHLTVIITVTTHLFYFICFNFIPSISWIMFLKNDKLKNSAVCIIPIFFSYINLSNTIFQFQKIGINIYYLKTFITVRNKIVCIFYQHASATWDWCIWSNGTWITSLKNVASNKVEPPLHYCNNSIIYMELLSW